MNIVIADPTPKTGEDVAAAYQAGYDSGYEKYPIDHPPVDTNQYYSTGYQDGYNNYPLTHPPVVPPMPFVVYNRRNVPVDFVLTHIDQSTINYTLQPDQHQYFDFRVEGIFSLITFPGVVGDPYNAYWVQVRKWNGDVIAPSYSNTIDAQDPNTYGADENTICGTLVLTNSLTP